MRVPIQDPGNRNEEFIARSALTSVRTVKTRLFVRFSSSEKNVIFMLTDKRGARMLWSTDVLKLENRWIFWLPKKEVPSFALAVNHGCLEDPILGSFLDIF